MNPFGSALRTWWQVPRKAGERIEHRQVSFLELFYDLVYVALIAQLSHDFSNHISFENALQFLALFIIVWWAWLNGTLYHDLHGNNDVKTRIFTFAQMIGVIGMSVFAHDAIGHNSVGFAVSYSFFQFILTFLWWRTGVHDPDHRALSRPYVAVFLINTLLFAGSVFVNESLRYWMWFIAMILSLILPLTAILITRKNEVARKQMEIISDITPSLVERFGLFTIIVLGEVVVAIVAGTSSVDHLDLVIGIKAILSVFVAIGLWWVYFDFISHRKPRIGHLSVGIWYYLHLPLTFGIVMVGAALQNIIKHQHLIQSPVVNKIFILGIVIFLVCVALLMLLLRRNQGKGHSHFRSSGIVMIIGSILMLVFIFVPSYSLLLLILAICVLILPIITGFFVWIRTL